MTDLLTIAHADWSIGHKKRWVTVARRAHVDIPWHIEPPRRLDDYLGKRTPTHHLATTLSSTGNHTLLGLDLPLGVPRCIAEPTGLGSFRELLTHLRDGSPAWAEFTSPCRTADQISPYRPFYPHTPKGSRRAHLIEGLGVDTWSDLLRRADTPEPGGAKPCPLCWCVGANQVGKAAITGWRELLLPLLDEDHVALWPMDGTFDDLLGEHTSRTIMAEVYPAEVYQWLEFDWTEGGKRTQTGRASQSATLLATLDHMGVMLDASTRALVEDGFGEGAAGEDPFDSFVGAVGMLLLTHGRRTIFEPEDDTERLLEGWILGRHDIIPAIKTPS